MGNEIRIEDIPDGKRFEDYPDDTVFVWDDHETDDDCFPYDEKENIRR